MDYEFSLVEVGKPLQILKPVEIHRDGRTSAFLESGTVTVYGDDMAFLFEQHLDAETIFFYEDFLFSKTPRSFDIYKRLKSRFEPVFRSETYGRDPFMSLKNVKFGRFFNAGEPGFVGFDGNVWKLYSISIKDIGLNYPVWPTNVQLKGGILTVDNIFNRNQDNIIIQNDSQILIYGFDEFSNLILQGKLETETGKFASGYFQNVHTKDIVLFEKRAFLLFSFEEDTKMFKKIYREKINDFNPKFIDVDKDGVDEMIYNSRYGQRIKIYNRYKNKFYTKKLQGELIQYFAQDWIFGQNKNGLQAFKIEMTTNERKNDKRTFKKDFKSLYPEIRYERSQREKLLKDSLDIGSLYQIDKNTAQARFALPGVDVKNIEFLLNYDGLSDKGELLGQGWSIDENKIVVIYGPSIYQEIKYYLVLKNVNLEIKKNNQEFTVEGYEVTFNEGEWEVQIDGTTWTFGGGGDGSGVVYQTKWRNWYGSGDDTKNRIFLPTEYHLSKIKFQNHTVHFDYERAGGRAFIKTIHDHKDRIDFFYAGKTLEKYKIEGVDYKEEVLFLYELEGGKRFLKGLSQRDEIFLSFDYENGRMVKIKTQETSIEYEYALSPGYDKVFSIDTKDLTNFEAFDLNELLAIGFNHGNKTVLKIYDGRMEELKNSEMNLENIKDILNINNIGLCLIFESGRIEILKKNGSNFESGVSFQFPKKTTFIAASDFVVFQENDVGVIERSDQDFKITKLFPANYTFSVFDQNFAFYDGQNVNFAFKQDKIWKTKKIKFVPGLLKDIQETVRLFNFSADFGRQIYDLFKNASLQLYGNMIVITKWSFENPNFKTYLQLMLMDETYQIFKEESFMIRQDSINEFVKDTNVDGMLFKVVYEYKDGHLSHKVVDFEGKGKDILNESRKELEKQVNMNRENIIKAINDIMIENEKMINQKASIFYNKNGARRDLIDEKVREERRKMNEILNRLQNNKFQELESMRDKHLREWENTEKQICQNMTRVIPNDYFMLDRGRYNFHLYDNEITSGYDKIVYSGNSFRVQRLQDYKTNIRLDDNCSLKLEESYQIVCKNFRLDLKETDLGMIVNGYPFFIASPRHELLVLFYKNVEPKIEKLNGALLRNNKFLITKRNTTVEVRPQFLRYFMPEYLINEVRLKYDDRSIVTAYEYDMPSLQYGRLVFNSVTVTPGRDKKKFGYVKNNSVYDGHGNFIKHLTHETEKSPTVKNNVRHDKTGLLVIYEKQHLSDNEMYFYGFENYEFDDRFEYEGRLVQGFSFTGENYLEAKILRAVFKPKYVDVYTISTWIRTENVKHVGDKTINVQVNFGLYGSLGEVLLERNGWYYVKVIFDMAEAQSVNEMLGRTSEPDLEIKIVDCDVDHIKYSPEKSSMEVKVYDYEGRVRETIDSNGLVRKFVYKNGRKSAEIDEYGDVSVFQLEGNRANFEMVGRGRFEEFSLSSFGKTVAIDDPTWSVSPAKLRHLNNEISILKVCVESEESFGLSFEFGLESQSEIALGEIKIHQKDIMTGTSTYDVISNDIELVKIKNKIFLFSGGNVLLEEVLNVSLDLKFKGVGFIKNLFVFENPSVRLRHYDALKNKIQDIKLRDENSAIVIEYLYDQLGRNDIVTSPYVTRSDNLFQYHEDFVRNKNPEEEGSVWKSGKIVGIPNEDGFMRIEYKNDPLNRKEVVQLPGNLTKRFIYDKKNAILNVLFPSGFYFVSEFKGDLEKTKVYDESNNWRATYLKDKFGKGTLSTYEYKGKLVTQILPPLYHENVGTLRKLKRGGITEKEKALKKKIGVNMKYNEKGLLVEKTSPDAGKTRYMYEDDKLKFIIYPNSVTYFQYDSGRLKNIGYLNSSILDLSENNTVLYQTLNYGLQEKNPILKDNVFRKITYDQTTIVEEIVETKDVLKKRIIFPGALTIEMTKKLSGNRLSMEYPVLINGKKLKVDYAYDRTGQLSNINGDRINVTLSYDVMNRLSVENFNGKFRRYKFSPAGFLTEISDEFMKEEISYDGSFTGLKFDEGIVHKLKFENRWIERTEADECFEIFKANNYTREEYQSKVFYSELDLNVPENCPSVLKKRFPIAYGHVYDYGKNDELVKAKFYIDRFESPLTMETFKMHNFTEETWKELVKFGFIVEDRELSRSTLARKGKSIVNEGVFKMSKHKRRIVEKTILAYVAGIEIKPETESFQVLKEISGNSPIEIGNILHENFIKIFKNKDMKKGVELLRESFATELGKAEFDVDYYAFDPNGNHRRYYNGIDRYELVYIQDTNKIDYMINRRQKFAFEHDEKGNVVKAEHKKIKKMTYNPVTNLVNEIEMDDEEGTKIYFSYDSEGERVKKSVFKNGSLKTNVFYFRDENGKVLLERKETYPEGEIQLTTYVYGNRGLIAFFRKDELYQVISDHEGSTRLVVKDEKVVAAYDYLPYGNLMREAVFDEDGLIFYRFTGQEYDPETGLYNYHARLYDPTIGRFYQIDPKWQSFSPYKYAGNSPVTMVDPDGEFFGILIAVAVAGAVGGYLAGAAKNNNWDPRDWDWKSKETWTAIGTGVFTGATIPISFAGSVGIVTATGLSTKVATTIFVAMTADNALRKLNVNANWDFSSPSTYWEFFKIISVSSKETKNTLDSVNFKKKLSPKEFLKTAAKRLAKTIIEKAKEISDEDKQEILEFVEKFLVSDVSEKKSMLKSFKKKAPFMLLHALLSNEEYVDKSAGENYFKSLIKRSKDASVTYEELTSKLEDFKKTDEYAYIKKAVNTLMNKKRGKRETDDIVLTSHDNVTVVSGLSGDLFYINEGSHDIRKPIEDGLNFLKRVYTEKDTAMVSELSKILQNEIEKRITDFKRSEEDGFVIIDDRYKLLTKLTLDLLSPLVGRNDSLGIKENLSEFVRKLHEETNFQKLLDEIQNPLEFIPEEAEDEKSTDSIVLSTYCEPFVGNHGKITDKTWMEELEGTSHFDRPLDPMFSPDLNGTLLLANVLLSKKQNKHTKVRKAKMSKRENAMLTTYAIIEAFEMQYPSINLDFYEIQKLMQESIANMRIEDIFPIIKSHIKGSDLRIFEQNEAQFESRLNKIYFKNCQRLAGYDQTDKPHLKNFDLAQQNSRPKTCDELAAIYSDGTETENIHCKNTSICDTTRAIISTP